MQKQARPRDEAFDMAKGVGIIAVVALHVSGRAARTFHEAYSNGWWILSWLNRFVNFCVPLFIIVSAILLARGASAQENPDWKRYALRRLKGVFWPLVAWTIIYWLVRAFVLHQDALRTTAYWTDIKGRAYELFFGKAHFHLYFLSALAQICIVLPFLVLFFRRYRTNFWTTLLIAMVLQTAAVLLQKVIRFRSPASAFYWYLWAIVPAIWIGMKWRDWPAIRKMTWPVWSFFAVAGGAFFAYTSYLDLMKLRFNGDLFNASTWAYALGMSFLIISGLTLWTTGTPQVRFGLRRLGEMSLQIYLMHPILLDFISRSSKVDFLRALPLPSLWMFLITLLGTYGVAELLNLVPIVNLVLFGRDLPPAKPKPEGDGVEALRP